MQLTIDSVQLSYGQRKILSDVYLSCTQGKVTGLLGRNGCGKTSLFKVIFGSLKADFATIRVDNQHIAVPFKTQRVGFLPQQDLLPPNLTLKKATKLLESKANQYFERFNIDENQKIGSLSGGQVRLAEVLLMLFAKHDFLILDEPFSHIAPVHVEAIQLIINEVKTEKGLLISDHQFRNVLPVSDEVYLLKDQKTHFLGSENIPEKLISLGYLLNF